MKIMGALVVLCLIAVAAMTGYAVGINNQLVALAQNADEKWSQVENVYQRRSDLIPNLVETVKGYAKHERATLTAVAKARAAATSVTVAPSDAASLKRYHETQGALSSVLARLLVSLERYPDLKADRGFRDLQSQLEGTENRIAVERQRFNAAVLDYNRAVLTFPGSVVATRAGYGQRPYFRAEAGAERAPRVNFQ